MRRRACLLRTLRPRTLRSSFAISLVTGLLGWLAPPLCAQNLPAPPTVFPHPDDEPVTISGQVNVISQWHPDFRALYSGDNSLRNQEERATSRVLTISTRVRLSRTTEVGVDVESAGGSGLSEALGVAGFTNLDVVRNPTLGSNPYLARLIVHHTRGPLDVTVGKLSTVDFFDFAVPRSCTVLRSPTTQSALDPSGARSARPHSASKCVTVFLFATSQTPSFLARVLTR